VTAAQEESMRHYIEDSDRRAYLNGEQSMKSMIGIIGATSVRGRQLRVLLDEIDKGLQQIGLLDEDKTKRSAT